MKNRHTPEPVYYRRPYLTLLASLIISLSNWAAWPVFLWFNFVREADGAELMMIEGLGAGIMFVGTCTGLFFACLADMRDESEHKIRDRLLFVSPILFAIYIRFYF